MDLFKMASQIANQMSNDDKDSLENMDMEQMIKHVTSNVFSVMKNLNLDDEEPKVKKEKVKKIEKIEELEELEELEEIYPKTRDICFDLNVSLEDLYMGKRKKLNVKRKRIQIIDNEEVVVEEKKKLVIPIEKGMKDGQEIRFAGEADQLPGYTPGDIIITIVQDDHILFERDEDDLILEKNINLYQSYNFSFDVVHLDNRVIRIEKEEIDTLHLNGSIRKIKGEGMPILNGNGNGDLFIRFNVVIPESLSISKLNQLRLVFEDDPLTKNNILNDDFNCKYVLESLSDSDIDSATDSSETDSTDSSDLSDLSDLSDSS
jgi:DnaJ-class molecular chaperone